MAKRRGKSGNSGICYFLGLQNHCGDDCNHEIKRHFFLERKAVTNLDSILKSRDIILPAKVCIVNAMVFPVVMYRCEGWTIKKAERRTINAFKLCHWRSLMRIPWTARRSNYSILKEVNPEYLLEGLVLKLQYSGSPVAKSWFRTKTLMLGKIDGKSEEGSR